MLFCCCLEARCCVIQGVVSDRNSTHVLDCSGFTDMNDNVEIKKPLPLRQFPVLSQNDFILSAVAPPADRGDTAGGCVCVCVFCECVCV